MDSNNVVLDIDGVLADFEKFFCQKFGNKNRHLVSLEARYPAFWDFVRVFIDMASTYENLDIVPIGVQIARWCKEHEFYVHLVSSRPSYTHETTQRWLLRNAIPYDYLSVDKTSKRARIININPLFIVDDLLEVCEQTSQIGIPSFLIDWPWNHSDNLPKMVNRIHNFSDFLGKMESFGEVYGERKGISRNKEYTTG